MSNKFIEEVRRNEKKFILITFSVVLLAVVSRCFFSKDEKNDDLAYVRLSNETGYIISNINAGGVIWEGPYNDGETTEQKAVTVGSISISWICNGSSYGPQVTTVDKGVWRTIVYNCDGANSVSVAE